jgi:hypothetical protein
MKQLRATWHRILEYDSRLIGAFHQNTNIYYWHNVTTHGYQELCILERNPNADPVNTVINFGFQGGSEFLTGCVTVIFSRNILHRAFSCIIQFGASTFSSFLWSIKLCFFVWEKESELCIGKLQQALTHTLTSPCNSVYSPNRLRTSPPPPKLV